MTDAIEQAKHDAFTALGKATADFTAQHDMLVELARLANAVADAANDTLKAIDAEIAATDDRDLQIVLENDYATVRAKAKQAQAFADAAVAAKYKVK